MWVYDPTHGRLLFRRMTANTTQKRVDIVFNDVRTIQVCTFFESIMFNEIDSTETVGKVPASEITNEPGLRWFKIISKDWEGYICAGSVGFHEDDAGFSEPSAIYEAGPLLVNLAVNSSWYAEKYEPAILKPRKWPFAT